MKRVYCLYRVSTKGQVDKDDIPMQKTSCREFAERNGWTILKEFQEKGVSGFKVSASDRDAIQDLKAAAEKKARDEEKAAELEAKMAEQEARLEQQRAEIERMLQEQKAYQEAALKAQREESAKKAEEDAARRRKLLEDVAASLQNSETSNMTAGAEGTVDYGYESELE